MAEKSTAATATSNDNNDKNNNTDNGHAVVRPSASTLTGESSPKVEALVEEISRLTLLETSQLVQRLKVCRWWWYWWWWWWWCR